MQEIEISTMSLRWDRVSGWTRAAEFVEDLAGVGEEACLNA